MDAFRLFEVRDGLPTTLFHGVDRDRTMPMGKWIEAEVEPVHDGTDGTTYQSGFHVAKTKEVMTEYLGRFEKERPLVICPVTVEDVWEKSHSPADVLLARWMHISPIAWAEGTFNPIDSPMAISEETRHKMREQSAALT